MRSTKGFTLIELLLVLAIIGIISAIAIPALLGQKGRGRGQGTVTQSPNPMYNPSTRNDLTGKSQDDVIAQLGYPDQKFEPTPGVTTWVYTTNNVRQVITLQNRYVLKHEVR